jgi:GNAT superfamily N-acetyltransferase
MEVCFRPYTAGDAERCLILFDKNCPEYFAPNERRDYANFLASNPGDYEVCIANGEIVGAFGLMEDEPNISRIEWILLNPNMQGSGIGSVIMDKVLGQARGNDVEIISIATSHKAYMFFQKFGAIVMSRTEDGWGAGMHKIDMELRL